MQLFVRIEVVVRVSTALIGDLLFADIVDPVALPALLVQAAGAILAAFLLAALLLDLALLLPALPVFGAAAVRARGVVPNRQGRILEVLALR